MGDVHQPFVVRLPFAPRPTARSSPRRRRRLASRDRPDSIRSRRPARRRVGRLEQGRHLGPHSTRSSRSSRSSARLGRDDGGVLDRRRRGRAGRAHFDQGGEHGVARSLDEIVDVL